MVAQLVAVSPDAGYAPYFAVVVEGQPVDEETRNDVMNIQVVSEIDQMTSFDLTFNNWDDRLLRFKYSEVDAEAFAVGRKVQICLGYADRLVPVTTGLITGLRPTFPESGSPTIGVSGTDGMQRLKRRKPKADEPKYYRGRTDGQIAKIIAARHGLAVEADVDGPVHPLVVQKNQDDATFLLERAKRIDFDCYIRIDPRGGKDTLFFRRPTDLRDGTPGARADDRGRVYELAYGPGLAAAEQRDPDASTARERPLVPNLITFTPTLKVSEQVTKVTVRGWDPTTKKPIAFTASAQHLPRGRRARGTSGPQMADRALGGREEVVIDAPVTSDEEARRLATALLSRQAYQFITGTGRIAGLPELRPGDNLEIHGIGRRFSGSYFVTRVEHTLGASGFFTAFAVRRIYDGDNA